MELDPVVERVSAPRRPPVAPPAPKPPRERLLSLDVFRGLTVAGMLLVNNPGTWGSLNANQDHTNIKRWSKHNRSCRRFKI
jgi:uncharacterized membrane protein YeiB